MMALRTLQWKGDMEDILAQATHFDTDQWVSAIAEILQSYPSTGCLNLEIDNSNSTFMEILTDLSKVGKFLFVFKDIQGKPTKPT